MKKMTWKDGVQVEIDVPDPLYDEDYNGPRWLYAMTHRPPGIGCAPTGRIIGADRKHPDWPFGTISYDRELTEHEVYAYELAPLGRLSATAATR